MSADAPQESQQAWTTGMLTQIARDLELIKARLGIITDAEGDTRYIPGSLLPRDTARRPGVPQDGGDRWTDLPGAPSEGEI